MSHVGLDGSTSAWEACSRLSSQGRLVVGRTGTPPLEGAK